MLKIVLCGATGKMGKALKEQAIIEKTTVEIVGEINRNSNGEDIHMLTSNCDVVVDFSLPEGTAKLLENVNPKTPLLICVTNLDETTQNKLIELSKTRPVLYAPNTSIGANLLSELAKIAAKSLPGYDIQIVDIHHNQKKDAPSGTAKRIASEISNSIKDENQEISISSLRYGNLYGIHKVIFAGPHEVFTIIHEAESRALFAEGAIKAAKFLFRAKPGRLYSMSDCIV